MLGQHKGGVRAASCVSNWFSASSLLPGRWGDQALCGTPTQAAPRMLFPKQDAIRGLELLLQDTLMLDHAWAGPGHAQRMTQAQITGKEWVGGWVASWVASWVAAWVLG